MGKLGILGADARNWRLRRKRATDGAFWLFFDGELYVYSTSTVARLCRQ